jgi:hypothetical protein
MMMPNDGNFFYLIAKKIVGLKEVRNVDSYNAMGI